MQKIKALKTRAFYFGAVSVSVFEPELLYFTNIGWFVKMIMGFLWNKDGMKSIYYCFTIITDNVIKYLINERSF